MADPRPLVSVVMPVRDEADAIGSALSAVREQDYPHELVEVLVVDGRSTDATRSIVEGVARDDDRVRLIDNPEGIVPTALNRGLGEAVGQVIVRVDGHCVIPGDYLRRCVELLDETGAACAGGMIDTVGSTLVARAIAAAQGSPFGVGGVAFRTGRRRPGPVDTLAFGAYRRDVFDQVGLFDEELVRNQDDEFNLRITERGGVIWLDPTLRTTYLSRTGLRRLWRQYFDYGRYKVRVVQKHGRVPSWRHAVPVVFVLALGAATALTLARRDPRPVQLVAGPYLVATATASVAAGRSDAVTLPVLPAAFATLHLAYGAGTVAGLWQFRHRWRG